MDRNEATFDARQYKGPKREAHDMQPNKTRKQLLRRHSCRVLGVATKIGSAFETSRLGVGDARRYFVDVNGSPGLAVSTKRTAIDTVKAERSSISRLGLFCRYVKIVSCLVFQKGVAAEIKSLRVAPLGAVDTAIINSIS